MAKNISTRKLKKNVMLSILAQLISLMASMVLGFIVPKFIDEYQYSYWQTYLLYVGYVGVLLFGLLDGFVLRYSQYDYEELDKRKLRSQFQIIIIYTTLLCLTGICISSIFLSGIFAQVWVLVSVGVITKNVITYVSYSFQITNRIKYYAFITIVQRLTYVLIVLILLLLRITDFRWFCVAELIGDIVGILISIMYNKGLYWGSRLPLFQTLKEVKRNLIVGIFLMAANFSSMFLLGGAKMVIQWRWDELIFGKAAFGFNVSNLFLNFVTAISVVLFPSLKRMDEDKLPELYGKIRNAVSPLLMLSLLMYFPLSQVLKIWLPKYTNSLAFLGIILPIIIFSSKVSLLTNNYLKAYRKEKSLLWVNVVTVLIGFGLVVFFAYVVDSIELLLCSVVFVTFIRYIVSEVIVLKLINGKNSKGFILELALTIVFVVSIRYFNIIIGSIIYSVALIIYFFIYKNEIINLFWGIKYGTSK